MMLLRLELRADNGDWFRAEREVESDSLCAENRDKLNRFFCEATKYLAVQSGAVDRIAEMHKRARQRLEEGSITKEEFAKFVAEMGAKRKAG